MIIADALRCGRGIRIAAVGAGGKSSLLFALSRQIPGKIIVTTTTHFALNQLSLGDFHFTDSEEFLMEKIQSAPEEAVIVLSGSKIQTDRINGPSFECLEEIKHLSDNLGYTILVEADGSRRLPLKAYGEDEPVIPKWIDTVVFVVGCSVINQTLNDDTVFRAGIFAELSGTPMGTTIQVESICRMLTHPKGGLKPITAHRRSIILFNQADQLSIMDRESIIDRKDELLTQHDAVVIAAIASNATDHPQEIQCFERIAGVVLAAGESVRLGYPKQLLTYQGISFLRRTVLRAIESGTSPIYVVLGFQAEQLKGEISDLPVRILENVNWTDGQSTSVKYALREILNYKSIGGILFMPVDQPFLSINSLRGMLSLHQLNTGTTIVPNHKGQPGSPVLIDQSHLKILNSVHGDQGGRAILKEINFIEYDVPNSMELIDIDTKENYQIYINEFKFPE